MGMMVTPFRFGGAAPAAPSFVAIGSTSNWAGSTPSTTPPTRLAGDLILVYCETPSGASAPPTGYTEMPGSPVSASVGSNPTTLNVYYRWATNTSADNVAFAAASYTDHMALCNGVIFRGVTAIGGNPYNAINTASLPATTTVNAPQVTTTIGNALLVMIMSHGVDGGLNRFTWTAGSGLTSGTERQDSGVSGGNGGGLTMFTAVQAVAGTAGVTQVAQTGAEVLAAMTLALTG